MRPNVIIILKAFVFFLLLFIYCEWINYYLILYNCDWPKLDPTNEDPKVRTGNYKPVHIMVLADTHLLGSREGHWFDKLRREWQMYRTFQTALSLHKPDLIFVLGDLTDEGLWCSEEEFQYYTKRFQSLFAIPNTTTMYVTVGNHDIGFHHRITPYLNQRFVRGFNSSSVQLITVHGNHLVLLNSMALEGDGCFLCKAAEMDLVKIEKLFKCTKNEITKGCDPKTKLTSDSRPILMQHFPLFRISDEDCDEPDEAPFPLKIQKFREGIDCLTKEATRQLLEQINPRLVLSGHTHHGCTKKLPNEKSVEISISSFSWRNKNNPSYGLVVSSPNNYAFSKCLMPQESSIINIYLFGGISIVMWILYSIYKISRKKKFKYH